MRLHVSVPLLLLGALSLLQAQSPVVRSAARIGILGGVNVASLGGSDADGLDSRTGVLVGASVLMPVSTGFAVDLGAMYSMKGATTSDASGSGAIKMDFIEIPALLRFDIPAAGDVKPFIVGGAAVSLRTKCDVEGSSGGTTVTFTCEEADDQFGTGTTQFQTVDGSLIIGGGLAFDVGGRVMTLGARYGLGLSTISDDANSKHRVLSFFATFEWPFRRSRQRLAF